MYKRSNDSTCCERENKIRMTVVEGNFFFQIVKDMYIQRAAAYITFKFKNCFIETFFGENNSLRTAQRKHL